MPISVQNQKGIRPQFESSFQPVIEDTQDYSTNFRSNIVVQPS